MTISSPVNTPVQGGQAGNQDVRTDISGDVLKASRAKKDHEANAIVDTLPDEATTASASTLDVYA